MKVTSVYSTFHADNFTAICKKLAKKDNHLRQVIREHGYPPMWTRPGTFPTLILTILEQQVSLASAAAAFRKLKERLGSVTPKKLMELTDEELRACYFSRQKIVYARGLASAIISKQLVLGKLKHCSDDEVRKQLRQLKGIGDWTVDVFLMHALQRTDLFPLGDIALVNSLRDIKGLPKTISKEEMLLIAEPWRPYRTIASMILWHAYIKKRKLVLPSI